MFLSTSRNVAARCKSFVAAFYVMLFYFTSHNAAINGAIFYCSIYFYFILHVQTA